MQSREGLIAHWWVGAVAIGVLLILIITGNVAVLTALRRTRRAPAHYPLASLAAADLLVGLFVVPIAAVRELFVIHLRKYLKINKEYINLSSFWSHFIN